MNLVVIKMEKVTLTNAESQRRFKENNPKIVELNQLRQISNRQEANKDRERANAVLNWEIVTHNMLENVVLF